ncbi:GNAT family N-acetyltransferase [Leekyejoonella antrihumi]|uniref:N-acetyltransferase domain-containing protein n=1 Tax=Leekyejoonella antrihumi TaxID=1660198 RepID=A0A563DXW7_9MICO|nr:GNAT family N-acetyltransferase [Leekyejoonella antrihumi]TWP34969.1 hypothetical protein FGL98_15625 [Leekyejoonella antrihumi]
MPVPSAALDVADRDARARARAAGVEIRKLTPDEAPDACSLLADVWDSDPRHGPMEASLLIALLHCDNYVSGAFDHGRMVGVCVGFFAAPIGTGMHSHIAGVIRQYAGRGVGTALKLHQRAWALHRGVTSISWTYDPLVARNAFFNLHLLGARVTQYVPDFYGEMSDGINDGQATDRLVVHWAIVSSTLNTAASVPLDAREFVVLEMDQAREPVLASGPPPDGFTRCRVAIPDDIALFRTRDRGVAARWRLAAREALVALLADRWVVTDFDRSGYYRLERN